MIQPFISTVFCDHHKTFKTPAKSRSKFVCHFYTEILQRSQKQDRKTPQKAASPERASLALPLFLTKTSGGQVALALFSATPSYNHRPRAPQALDGALRFASSFTYDTPPAISHSASSFLQLPDPVSRFGPVRRPAAGPFPSPPQDIQDWLKAGAIRLHTNEEYQLPGADIISSAKSAWIN